MIMPIRPKKSKRIKRFIKSFKGLSKTEKAAAASAITIGAIAGGPVGVGAAIGTIAAGEFLIRGSPKPKRKRLMKPRKKKISRRKR